MFAGALLLLMAIPFHLASHNSLNQVVQPWLVGAVIDTARILGLPKMKVRDSYGRLYAQDQSCVAEFIDMFQQTETQIMSQTNQRKVFIQNYVRK